MIRINKRSLDGGSCNFCKQGKVSDSGLVFPYDFIYEITGDSNLSVRICQKCFTEILNQYAYQID